ncbi:DNA repair protein XRCC4 [Arachis duranensis]|uniref:DNA repair protein XRCC4 n=2 Tax=Arachis TaxID=3817 RepID=A0A6P4BJ00_ARADU|nr:DNA repair protein XRCC4 [Arachis duranensis]XP_015940736.1 DNA repair protein XRCC4 [Arachis duranensis]
MFTGSGPSRTNMFQNISGPAPCNRVGLARKKRVFVVVWGERHSDTLILHQCEEKWRLLKHKMEETKKHTCLKLLIPVNSTEGEPIFVKGTWFPTRFDLAITDGFNAWFCNASEEEVNQRASQWDQPVSEYVELAERYLGFQQPGSVYDFADAGDGHKRLSWTFEKEGMTLQWRWKCKQSPNCKKTTAEILDFLMDANITLSEEVIRKNELYENMKVEAEKCLAQSERVANEKAEFEAQIYTKFLGVLNSKKSKLRDLRDQLSKQDTAKRSPQVEEDTDKTESFDEESFDNSDEDPQQDVTASSKDVSKNKPSRRKRTRLT